MSGAERWEVVPVTTLRCGDVIRTSDCPDETETICRINHTATSTVIFFQSIGGLRYLPSATAPRLVRSFDDKSKT